MATYAHSFHRLKVHAKCNLLCAVFLAVAVIPPSYSDAQTNVTIEQYNQLDLRQRDQAIVAIANQYAEYYSADKARQIKALFNETNAGASHSPGVDKINNLIAQLDSHQSHEASLNTLIGKYLVETFGLPPNLAAEALPAASVASPSVAMYTMFGRDVRVMTFAIERRILLADVAAFDPSIAQQLSQVTRQTVFLEDFLTRVNNADNKGHEVRVNTTIDQIAADLMVERVPLAKSIIARPNFRNPNIEEEIELREFVEEAPKAFVNLRGVTAADTPGVWLLSLDPTPFGTCLVRISAADSHLPVIQCFPQMTGSETEDRARYEQLRTGLQEVSKDSGAQMTETSNDYHLELTTKSKFPNGALVELVLIGDEKPKLAVEVTGQAAR